MTDYLGNDGQLINIVDKVDVNGFSFPVVLGDSIKIDNIILISINISYPYSEEKHEIGHFQVNPDDSYSITLYDNSPVKREDLLPSNNDIIPPSIWENDMFHIPSETNFIVEKNSLIDIKKEVDEDMFLMIVEALQYLYNYKPGEPPGNKLVYSMSNYPDFVEIRVTYQYRLFVFKAINAANGNNLFIPIKFEYVDTATHKDARRMEVKMCNLRASAMGFLNNP